MKDIFYRILGIFTDKHIVCSICLYGDGLWENGRDTSIAKNLPVCSRCAKDGWKIATVEDIRADEQLKEVVDYSYSNK